MKHLASLCEHNIRQQDLEIAVQATSLLLVSHSQEPLPIS